MLRRFFTKNWLIFSVLDPEIMRAIKLYAKGKLIDIGCGNKPYFSRIEPFILDYTGLDHNDTIHDKSKIDLFGSAYNVPIQNEYFDTVFCTEVLEHLEEPDKAIKETNRILKNGGYAIYSMPLFWHLHEEPRDFYRYTKYGLKYLFEKNGFEIVELIPLSGFWVTFGQELVYYLWRFRVYPKLNPLSWLISALGLLIQAICFILNKIDLSHEFTFGYLLVAIKKNDS